MSGDAMMLLAWVVATAAVMGFALSERQPEMRAGRYITRWLAVGLIATALLLAQEAGRTLEREARQVQERSES